MLCMAQIEVMGERADVERGDVLRSLKYLEQYWASVDPVAQYGNMYRCHLDNGECQWLCPYHAAKARGNVELHKQQVIDAAQPLPRRPMVVRTRLSAWRHRRVCRRLQERGMFNMSLNHDEELAS